MYKKCFRFHKFLEAEIRFRLIQARSFINSKVQTDMMSLLDYLYIYTIVFEIFLDLDHDPGNLRPNPQHCYKH